MLNLNKPTCQLINGSVSTRSLWAEKMAATHNAVRCSTHNLFHNWQEMTAEQKRDAAGRRYGTRFDGFVELTPGKWVLRDHKPSKKKGKSSGDED